MKQSFCPDCQPIMISYNTLKPKILTAHVWSLLTSCILPRLISHCFIIKLKQQKRRIRKESTLTIGGWLAATGTIPCPTGSSKRRDKLEMTRSFGTSLTRGLLTTIPSWAWEGNIDAGLSWGQKIYIAFTVPVSVFIFHALFSILWKVYVITYLYKYFLS